MDFLEDVYFLHYLKLLKYLVQNFVYKHITLHLIKNCLMTLANFKKKAETFIEALLPFWFFFTLRFCLKDGFVGYKKWLTIVIVAILILYIIRNVSNAKGSFEKWFQAIYPIAVIAGMTYLFMNFN